MDHSRIEEEAAYRDACKKLLFSDGTRTALVLLSLFTLFPIGIVSIVFWILARKAGGHGERKKEAENYHEAETMALTSISFGLCTVLTILICIPQLKRGIIWSNMGQNIPSVHFPIVLIKWHITLIVFSHIFTRSSVIDVTVKFRWFVKMSFPETRWKTLFWFVCLSFYVCSLRLSACSFLHIIIVIVYFLTCLFVLAEKGATVSL